MTRPCPDLDLDLDLDLEWDLEWDLELDNYFKNPPYQLKEEEKDQRGSKDFSYDQNKFQRR